MTQTHARMSSMEKALESLDLSRDENTNVILYTTF